MGFHPARICLRLALLGWLAVQAAAMADTGAAPGPSPKYGPREVVEIQLTALQQVDVPVKDAGIAIVYRFASPENRGQTGPLRRFAQILHEGYPELLNHRSHTLPLPVVQGDEALQAVELTTRSGRMLRFVFILRQQLHGPYKDCWMTDGVVQPDEQPQGQET